MKRFKLEQDELKFDEGTIIYNKIRLKCQKIAKEAQENFELNFFDKFTDIHDIYDNYSAASNEYLAKAVDWCIKDLISKGVFDLSDEEFKVRFFQKYDVVGQGYQEVEDNYLQIILNADELEQYREYKKQNRGGVIGGGFGLEGAVAGVAVAGIANLAFGAIGGAFDAIGRSVENSEARDKCKKLFVNIDTRKALSGDISERIKNIHIAYCDAIDTLLSEEIISRVTEEDTKKSKAICINIEKGRIEQNAIRANLISALNKNPYQEHVYALWMEEIGDKNNELGQISDFFGLNVVNLIKSDLFSKKKESLKFGSESEVSESIDVLEEFSKEIGFNDFETIKESLTIVNGTYEFLGEQYKSSNEVIKAKRQLIKKELRGEHDDLKGVLKKEIDQFLNSIYTECPDDNDLSNYALTATFLTAAFVWYQYTWWAGLLALFIGVAITTPLTNMAQKNSLNIWLKKNENKIIKDDIEKNNETAPTTPT